MAPVKCSVPGCTMYARHGHPTCIDHKSARARARAPQPDPPGSAFFGVDLATRIQEASELDGIDDVIGALRLTLMEIMRTETEPAKLASGVAKIAGVLVAAQRAKRVIGGDAADGITDAVAAIVNELTGL